MDIISNKLTQPFGSGKSPKSKVLYGVMGYLPVRMQLDLRSPRTTNDARSSPQAPRHSWGAGYRGGLSSFPTFEDIESMQIHQQMGSFIAVSQDSPVFGKELKVAGGHEYPPTILVIHFGATVGSTWFFTTSTQWFNFDLEL